MRKCPLASVRPRGAQTLQLQDKQQQPEAVTSSSSRALTYVSTPGASGFASASTEAGLDVWLVPP